MLEKLEKLSKVILDLYQGSQEVPMAQFQDWAFDRLQSVIRFDSALWLTGVLHAERDNATFHTRHTYRLSLSVLSDWSQCKDAAVFSKRVFASPGTTLICTPSAEFGAELAAHSKRYKIEHILATTLVQPIAAVRELISIYRSDIAQPFSEDERLLQQSLVPHLSATWRMCRMRHLSNLTLPTCALDACAAGADSQGSLYLIDSSFTRLLLEEWPEWNGPQLPPELLEACQRNESQYLGRCSFYLIFRLDDHILLRGRSKRPIDELSPRELEVARLYAQGNSYKEIAGTLRLSPSTVRNHVGNVYCKLGIDNKAALAAIVNEHDKGLPGGTVLAA